MFKIKQVKQKAHNNLKKSNCKEASRNKIMKSLCLAALVLMVTEMASATTLES